jgi:calcineurin-like phosphoesterase family protein
MLDWDGKFHGSVHLHGHQHNLPSVGLIKEQRAQKRYDVGVDMYGGPVEVTGGLLYLNTPKGWE